MDNKVVDYHPIRGYITFSDLINDLEKIKNDYCILEEIIRNILTINKYNNKTIESLFKNNIDKSLEYIISIMRNIN